MKVHYRFQLLSLATVLSAPVAAHHSTAQYDTTQEVSIEGTVLRYDFRNPHVYMTLQVTGANGETYEQEVEAGASSVLLPLGLTPDSVVAGERVTVQGNPSRRGARRSVLGRYLVNESGAELPLNLASRSIRAAANARAESIEGTWFAPSSGFYGLMGSRQAWQLTADAQTASESFNGTTEAAHASCVPVTAPTLMVYPVTTVVDVLDDRVVMDVDWMSSRRVIYLDGREHPQNGERSLHGHSVGHWEGDTLVVDTQRFSDHREGLAFGIPSGARKRLIETFSLSANGRQLDYSVTMTDPDHLLAPVEYQSSWDYRPDLMPSNQECDMDVAQKFLQELEGD